MKEELIEKIVKMLKSANENEVRKILLFVEEYLKK